MKIVLIGFMGSGKSTVAALLAKSMNLNCVETDKEIAESQNFSSVAELFAKLGESKFRELESEKASALRDATNIIISPGGGMIINEKNQKNLRHNATTIFLDTSFEEVIKRVQKQMRDTGEKRPLFSNLDEALALYEKRLPIYEKCSDITITTTGRSINEVHDEILEKLKSVS